MAFTEIDIETSTQELVVALQMDTGYTEVPSVYFGNEHVGGLDDLKSYLTCKQSVRRLIDENGITSSQTEDEEEFAYLYEKLE